MGVPAFGTIHRCVRREVISRYLAEWERMGWVHAARGSIEVKNRAALASYGGGEGA